MKKVVSTLIFATALIGCSKDDGKKGGTGGGGLGPAGGVVQFNIADCPVFNGTWKPATSEELITLSMRLKTGGFEFVVSIEENGESKTLPYQVHGKPHVDPVDNSYQSKSYCSQQTLILERSKGDVLVAKTTLKFDRGAGHDAILMTSISDEDGKTEDVQQNLFRVR